MDQNRESEFDTIRRFYDDVYYRDVGSDGKPSRHLRRIARRLELTSGEKLLDVACGDGRWLMAAAERGAAVAGIDLSKTAIAVARRRLPLGELHCGPAENLPFPDQSFDVVTCLGSLEHFVDPASALNEMVRVSRPEARILLLVPNSGFLTRRLGLYTGTYQVDAKEDVRSIREWEALFHAAGLFVAKRWKDLHVLSPEWLLSSGWRDVPPRFAQAIALPLWPLSWQYQIYFNCRKQATAASAA
jgi:2-polyprenyl-3-methyl-5-hydroxy-6-metoxy-1,4-benzoquinol methylase